MLKKIHEVLTDYTDTELNLTYIDVYHSSNASGKTVAVVDRDTKKVIYFDNGYRLISEVTEAIAEVLKDIEAGKVISTEEKNTLLRKGETKVILDISTLYTIYNAGFEHGVNEGPTPKNGTFNAFHNVLEGKPREESDGSYYDIAHKINLAD